MTMREKVFSEVVITLLAFSFWGEMGKNNADICICNADISNSNADIFN